MTAVELLRESWYESLSDQARALIRQAVYLLDREKGFSQDDMIVSYDFLVFSAAKAYEGFLKDYFLSMGFIDEGLHRDEYFRIGRSLNPDLPQRFRDESWLYDDVAEICNPALAEQLWLTWKECRNKVFHYTVTQAEVTSIEVAESLISQVLLAMKAAVMCEVNAHGRFKD